MPDWLEFDPPGVESNRPTMLTEEKKRREGEEPFYGLVIKIIRNNDASIVHRKGTREPLQGNKAENFQPVFRSLSLSLSLFTFVVMRSFFLQTTTRTSMKRVNPNNGKSGSGKGDYTSGKLH